MSVNAPFTPAGNTVTFTANVAAPAAVQAVSLTPGGNQYRIINQSSNVTVFLGFANTAAQAANNAVVVSTTAPSMPLLPGTDEILTFVPNAYFSGITSANMAVVFITPGDGT